MGSKSSPKLFFAGSLGSLNKLLLFIFSFSTMDDLASSLSQLDVGKDDIKNYDQLQFKHSSFVKSFRSKSSCFRCFVKKYNLDRNIVKNLYTTDSIFYKLNLFLCRGDPGSSEELIRMYTLLLSEAIFDVYESLPNVVYRGVNYSTALLKLYKKNEGKIIYYYSFTSTTRNQSVAQGFGTTMIKIRLQGGSRDCVADVSKISRYEHEKEILISSNSGFRIDRVDLQKRIIEMTLVDQSHCIKEKTRRLCLQHKDSDASPKSSPKTENSRGKRM